MTMTMSLRQQLEVVSAALRADSAAKMSGGGGQLAAASGRHAVAGADRVTPRRLCCGCGCDGCWRELSGQRRAPQPHSGDDRVGGGAAGTAARAAARRHAPGRGAAGQRARLLPRGALPKMSRNISEYLEISRSISKHLETSQANLRHRFERASRQLLPTLLSVAVRLNFAKFSLS
eukprot:SAG31_NODE_81_length_27131_cov_4.775283_3_plen_176_part_00